VLACSFYLGNLSTKTDDVCGWILVVKSKKRNIGFFFCGKKGTEVDCYSFAAVLCVLAKMLVRCYELIFEPCRIHYEFNLHFNVACLFRRQNIVLIPISNFISPSSLYLFLGF
jgi:hypothetical protein